MLIEHVEGYTHTFWKLLLCPRILIFGELFSDLILLALSSCSFGLNFRGLKFKSSCVIYIILFSFNWLYAFMQADV